jgi:hypothetical protein
MRRNGCHHCTDGQSCKLGRSSLSRIEAPLLALGASAQCAQTPSVRHGPPPFASRPPASSANLPWKSPYPALLADSIAKMPARSGGLGALERASARPSQWWGPRAATVWGTQAARSSSKNGRSGSRSTASSGGPASLAVALLPDSVGQEVTPKVCSVNTTRSHRRCANPHLQVELEVRQRPLRYADGGSRKRRDTTKADG